MTQEEILKKQGFRVHPMIGRSYLNFSSDWMRGSLWVDEDKKGELELRCIRGKVYLVTDDCDLENLCFTNYDLVLIGTF